MCVVIVSAGSSVEMALTEEEIKRLYRIHKTLMQMLKDRGYFIADSEITMTINQFVRKHGDNMKREDLVTLKAKRNDNNDQVILCSSLSLESSFSENH